MKEFLNHRNIIIHVQKSVLLISKALITTLSKHENLKKWFECEVAKDNNNYDQ